MCKTLWRSLQSCRVLRISLQQHPKSTQINHYWALWVHFLWRIELYNKCPLFFFFLLLVLNTSHIHGKGLVHDFIYACNKHTKLELNRIKPAAIQSHETAALTNLSQTTKNKQTKKASDPNLPGKRLQSSNRKKKDQNTQALKNERFLISTRRNNVWIFGIRCR